MWWLRSKEVSDMKALLIDYNYCTGCHACEVACKKELELPKGQYGIHVLQDGPRQLLDGTWEYRYIPLITSLCDMCTTRVRAGKSPTCVHHCPARIISYGATKDLLSALEAKPGAVLFAEKGVS
jgi:Fe-S-cluster-containing dehydrogenase component